MGIGPYTSILKDAAARTDGFASVLAWLGGDRRIDGQLVSTDDDNRGTSAVQDVVDRLHDVVDVRDHVRTGDANWGVSLQRAADYAAANSKRYVYINGTNTLTRRGAVGGQAGYEYAILLTSTHNGLRFIGDGAGKSIINFPSSTANSPTTYCAAFFLNGCSDIKFDGIDGRGDSSDNDLATNMYYFITVGTSGCQRLGVTEDCVIRNCGPLQYFGPASGTTPSRFLNFKALVLNAPNALVPCTTSRVLPRFFNDSVVSTRSHAIYQFGRWSQLYVEGGYFENITLHCLKWKGNSAEFDYKRQLVFANNTIDRCDGGMLEVGSLSEASHCVVTCTGNVCVNAKLGVTCYAGTLGTITGNVLVWDWRANQSALGAALAAVAIHVNYTGMTTSNGDIADTWGWNIAGNVIANDANFVGVLEFNANPSIGDTVVVGPAGGTTTYTWVATGTVSTTAAQVVIGTTKAASAIALCDKIRGKGAYTGNHVYAINAALFQPKRCFSTTTLAATPQVVIDGMITFTLSVTGSAITVQQAPTDYVDILEAGVSMNGVILPSLVVGNLVHQAKVAYYDTMCDGVAVMNNLVSGAHSSVAGPRSVHSLCSVRGRHEGNQYVMTGNTTDTNNGRRLEIDSGFDLSRNNDGFGSLGGSFTAKEYGLGGNALITAADGKAKMLMWYGQDSLFSAAQRWPANELYRWNDGDTVNLNDVLGGNSYTFTYKNAAPGALEFSTKAELITLIGASTGGNFSAAAVTDWRDIASTLIYDYILIKFEGATRVNGNSAVITVTTRSRLCGQLPGQLQRSGTGTNLRKVQTATMIGGAATAIKHVFFTPAAALFNAPQVTPANAAAVSLGQLYFAKAETSRGIAYVGTSASAAGGTEQWWMAA